MYDGGAGLHRNAVKFQLIKMMFAVVRQDRIFEQRGLDKAQAETHNTEERVN